MYIKLKNNKIEQYPYSVGKLRQDNKDTSFPDKMSDETLAEWNVFPVIQTEYPQVNYTKNVTEGEPQLINGNWTQVWNVIDKLQIEIDEITKSLRADAYRNESDTIFFKWQRNEATQQEWLDKVNEIKQRWS
jgi:hypothetical protein